MTIEGILSARGILSTRMKICPFCNTISKMIDEHDISAIRSIHYRLECGHWIVYLSNSEFCLEDTCSSSLFLRLYAIMDINHNMLAFILNSRPLYHKKVLREFRKIVTVFCARYRCDLMATSVLRDGEKINQIEASMLGEWNNGL